MSKYQAFIFDMDGVLLSNSEHYWKQFEENLFPNLIPGWQEKYRKDILGLSIQDEYSWITKNYPEMKLNFKEFQNIYNSQAEIIYQSKAKLILNFKKFILALEKKGIKKIGLVSSSPRNWIQMAITRFNLEKFFSAITSADELNGEGKPSPKIYLLGSKKLQVEPKFTITLEDSKNGLLSAKNAGIGLRFGFRNNFNEEQNLGSISDYIVKDPLEIIKYL